MIEIYYMEDDEIIANTVKEYLGEKNFTVTIFPTIKDGKRGFMNHIPDMALVDWNMPDGQGDGFCQWIHSNWRELPIIFLTVRGDSHDIVSGFQNGADDYVVKPFELEILYSRICALLRRVGDVSKQYLSCDLISIDLKKMMVFYDFEEINLSPSEYQLLLFLMQRKGTTITREKILEQVWDLNGNYVNDNTLTVTMKRLREKLHQPSCLKTVRSVGYRIEDTL